MSTTTATARRSVLRALNHLSSRTRALEDKLLTRHLALYGVAVSRILGGSAYLGILLTEFHARGLLFGQGSDWARTYRDMSEQTPWIGLLENFSGPAFTAFYLATIAIGFAFVLGWHARLTGAVFLFGCIQILEMNPLVSDQGDNILRIGVFLILLTECSAVWSLDARRRSLHQARGTTPRFAAAFAWLRSPVVSTARVLAHNGAVIVLALQLVTIYVAAAMYKIPGNGWRMGTAISYPLRGDEYRVWPALNDLVVSSGILVWFMTYFAVYLQLYFPVLLLNKVTRRIALASVIGLHVGIAILMGLPWFTLAMVAFDSILVSTATYQAIERQLFPLIAGAVRRRLGRPARSGAVSAPVPAQREKVSR